MSKVRLRRKKLTEVEAVQYTGLNNDELTQFDDRVDFDHSGGWVNVRGSSVRIEAGDWLCIDAEGYPYVLADSLKQKIYDEVS